MVFQLQDHLFQPHITPTEAATLLITLTDLMMTQQIKNLVTAPTTHLTLSSTAVSPQLRASLMTLLTLLTVIDHSHPMEAVATLTAMTLLLTILKDQVNRTALLPVMLTSMTQTLPLTHLVRVAVMTPTSPRTLEFMITDTVDSHTLRKVLRPMAHLTTLLTVLVRIVPMMHTVHLSTVEQVVTLGTVVTVILALPMENKHQVMKTVASMLATTEDSTSLQI